MYKKKSPFLTSTNLNYLCLRYHLIWCFYNFFFIRPHILLRTILYIIHIYNIYTRQFHRHAQYFIITYLHFLLFATNLRTLFFTFFLFHFTKIHFTKKPLARLRLRFFSIKQWTAKASSNTLLDLPISIKLHKFDITLQLTNDNKKNKISNPSIYNDWTKTSIWLYILSYISKDPTLLKFQFYKTFFTFSSNKQRQF